MMKTRHLLFLCVLSLVPGPVMSETVNVGITPIFGKISSSVVINGVDIAHDKDLGLTGNVNMFEVNAGVSSSGVSLKGFYVFPKIIEGVGILPSGVREQTVGRKDEAIPVDSRYSLSMARVELSTIMRVDPALIIEPIVMWQWILPKLEISGSDYSFSRSPKISNGGIGVELTENVTNYSSLKVKYIGSSDSSLCELKYLLRYKHGAVTTGWMWWRFDSDKAITRLSGPFLEVSLGF